MLTIVKISQIFVRIQNVSVLIRASNNTARAPVRTVKFSVGLPFTEQTVSEHVWCLWTFRTLDSAFSKLRGHTVFSGKVLLILGKVFMTCFTSYTQHTGKLKQDVVFK